MLWFLLSDARFMCVFTYGCDLTCTLLLLGVVVHASVHTQLAQSGESRLEKVFSIDLSERSLTEISGVLTKV